MSHRLPQHIVDLIEEAIEAANLGGASFGDKSKITVQAQRDGAKPVEYNNITEMIKEKVKLYHNSWIIKPLKRVISWSESVDDGSALEFDILGKLRSKHPNPAVLELAHKEITELRQKNAELEDFRRRVEGAMKEISK